MLVDLLTLTGLHFAYPSTCVITLQFGVIVKGGVPERNTSRKKNLVNKAIIKTCSTDSLDILPFWTQSGWTLDTPGELVFPI